MRWEVFWNDDTHTVTVVDAPEGHDFVMPGNLGTALGEFTTEPGQRFIMSKNNELMKTWLTHRFALLGIDGPVERFDHLPML